jgi:hypothetical protein
MMAAEGGVALGVPFIGPEAGRWAVEGAWPAAVNGAVLSGGGNGEGKQGVGEMKGAVATFHFAMGGEGVLCRGGKTATQSTRCGSSNRDDGGCWMTEGGRQ